MEAQRKDQRALIRARYLGRVEPAKKLATWEALRALPEGVKALDDPDLVVVHVLEAKAEPAPTEAAPTEGAEPEVIRKAKAEGEEEEK